jgi:hypothetical protein
LAYVVSILSLLTCLVSIVSLFTTLPSIYPLFKILASIYSLFTCTCLRRGTYGSLTAGFSARSKSVQGAERAEQLRGRIAVWVYVRTGRRQGLSILSLLTCLETILSLFTIRPSIYSLFTCVATLFPLLASALIREFLSILFSIGAAKQRAVFSLLAHVHVHPGIVHWAEVIRATSLPHTVSLRHRTCGGRHACRGNCSGHF